MGAKIKRALITFLEDTILIECPFCGMHLIKTDFKKIVRLLNESATPPKGRQCSKCGGVAVLKLSSSEREIVTAKFKTMDGKDGSDAPPK